jgi:hypothetical protein
MKVFLLIIEFFRGILKRMKRMIKDNIFKSNKFYLDKGDKVNILAKDTPENTVVVALQDEDGNIEDMSSIPEATVEITTTYVGTFEILVFTGGEIVIDWGDGSLEYFNTTGNPVFTPTHEYTEAGEKNIKIKNAKTLYYLVISATYDVTAVVVPAVCTSVQRLVLAGTGITEFTTHPEWVDLYELGISGTGITSITTYPEWVEMDTINAISTPLLSLETHPEWVKLRRVRLDDSSVTSLITYDTWVEFRTLGLSNCNISNIEIHPEWVDFRALGCDGCAIAIEANIDNILVNLDATGMTATPPLDVRNIYLDSGTNAPPTPVGDAAKANLEARNVNVYTNT